MISLIRRILLFLSKLKNKVKFSVHGIKYGRNLCIHGHLPLRKASNGSITIGDNFYLSSGIHLNPLSRNLEGYICCNSNAQLYIGNNVSMSSTVIWAHKNIHIGNNVMCGSNVVIMDSDAHSMNYLDRRNLLLDMKNKKDDPITIGDDVFIGMNSIILKGVSIGSRTIIGAGSVVTRSIPSDCIACGNPAQIIKRNLNS